MKRLLLALALVCELFADPLKQPKLVVAIVIDQFRYKYLTRFRTEFHAGSETLLTRGAVFTNAGYQHFPILTAPGHSTVLTEQRRR